MTTGALPAEYGLSTTGVIDIQTKSGLFALGGFGSMYGGGYSTLQPSGEYGGSFDGYNYYVSGDFLSTNHGSDRATPAVRQDMPRQRPKGLGLDSPGTQSPTYY